MTGDVISSDDPGIGGPSGRPERARRAGVRTTALTAALTLVTTAGVATAIYRSTTSGPNPATEIPSSAFAVATLHLDLPGGQEQAVDHLLSLFPGVHLPGSGSLKDRAVRAMFHASTPPVDYDQNIKPWLGDTMTFAGWLDNGKPAMEIVLASTDDAAAREHVPATMDPGMHFAVRDGWVVIGNSQADVDAAVQAAASSSLADSGPYTADVGALPSDEAATGWLDGPAALKVLRGVMDNGLGGSMFGGLMMGSTGLGRAFAGRLAVGLHATDGVIQLDMRDVGAPASGSGPSSMLTQLPAGTIGAFELGDTGSFVDGMSKALTLFGSLTGGVSESCSVGGFQAYPVPAMPPGMKPADRRRLKRIRMQIRRQMRQQVQRQRQQCVTHQAPPVDPLAQLQHALGISFPDGVKTILGDRAVLAFGGLEPVGLPDVAIRTHPTDLSSAQSQAQTLATHLAATTPLKLSTSTAGDDLVLATSSSYAAEVGKAGTFGDDPQVKTALAGLPDTVGAALYVDLSRIWPLTHAPDAVRHLKAIGMWQSTSGDVSTGQLRVVFG